AAGLRQALSREQLEATERRAEAERLRASLAEAAAVSAESERAIDELTGEKRDGAGRLRELREANIRLQEKLAARASPASPASATTARRRRRWRRSAAGWLSSCGSGWPPAKPAAPWHQKLRHQASEKLSDLRRSSWQKFASGWSARRRLDGLPQSPPTPSSKCPEKPDGESQSAAATTATLRERRRAEAAEAALASARSELATTQAELAKVRTELAEAFGRLSESGVGDLDDTGGDSRRRRYSVVAAEDARKLPDEADEDIEVHRENPEGRSGWRPGLWRTSYCSNDLEGLRRACLSLAAERDRLSGDCRHYRRLYEEERRLRRRLTDEVRRLNCTDGRGRALRMMAADPPAAFDRWTSPKIPGDPEMASFSTYLRSKYSVT
uniref:Coiled-coil domain-containing protein 102A n=1 Tax=Macrostomum lignano TaxID=282301 RepID=A0A1I8IEI7_9PLAT